MVSLKIIDLDLPQNITHESTDWEVATDLLFSNIVLSSMDDVNNKTSILFNFVLDPTIKYYARARSRLNTGYTIWGNIDIFTPKDINDIELDSDMPAVIAPPTLATSSTADNHSPTLFTITATGFNVLGTASHTTTSWYIEKLDGEIVFQVKDDTINKTHIEVNSVILEENNIYRIRAVFKSSSNDVSQVATKTIKVGGPKVAKVVNVLNSLSITSTNELTLAYRPGIVHSEWELWGIEGNSSSLVWSEIIVSGDVLKVTLPANTLKNTSRYVLKAKTNLDSMWSFNIFNTY